MEFGQACKPLPHQTLWEFNNCWVIGCCWTDTTVDSMCPFISFRCKRLMMQIPPSCIAGVVRTSARYCLWACEHNHSTYTYGCQSLYFTYSLSQASADKANICQVQAKYSTILGYPLVHSIFWWRLPYSSSGLVKQRTHKHANKLIKRVAKIF